MAFTFITVDWFRGSTLSFALRVTVAVDCVPFPPQLRTKSARTTIPAKHPIFIMVFFVMINPPKKMNAAYTAYFLIYYHSSL
jgi:hypothetical protein